MSDFDYGNYLSNLDLLLKAAQEDYKQITYDRRNLQHSILRNYLWLATAIVSAQITYFINMTSEKPFAPWLVQPSICFYFFIIVALALSGIAFAYGIDTMRGRVGVCFPYEYAYNHMTDMAHKEASSQLASGSLRVYMIQTLEIAINHQREIARETGEKLRHLCRLLLFSLLFMLVSILGTFGNI